MNLESLRADVKHSGWMRSVLARVVSRLQRCVGLHVYRVNVRPLGGRRAAPTLPGGTALRIVRPDELLRAAADPELEMSLDFIRGALARGDIPFGAFEGDRLVGYLWRTATAAPFVGALWARVQSPCHYAYKAFTRPSHRGNGIHAAITLFADIHLLERGYPIEVGIVDVTNLASLGAAKSLGRRKVGYAGYVNWLGRVVPFRTPAVKKIGAELFVPSSQEQTANRQRTGWQIGDQIG